MYLTPEERAIGKENFYAAVASKQIIRSAGKSKGVSNRDFLLKQIRDGLASGKGLGAYYFGYENEVKEPLRVGVIGTGDEGSVLIGALNPKYLEVKAISDIRPYSVYRAFEGEVNQPVRPGLKKVYGWTDEQAKKNVKVYGPWQDLIKNAKADGVEAIIIGLPLHLHAPVAIAAMQAGLHVLTEKLMAHSVAQCKEMARVAKETKLYLAVGHQRHYNILYDNAVELIRNGVLGDVHYVAAQWHRNNLPGNDSWQQPLPPGVKQEVKKNKLLEDLESLQKKLATAKKEFDVAKNAEAKAAKAAEIQTVEATIRQKEKQIEDKILHETKQDGKTLAEVYGYTERRHKMEGGEYVRPAIEELIRWRLWDRTGGGMMAELGSHQLDASSIVVAAMHSGQKQHPISVGAVGNRPVFPADRDIEDHVYCVFEFPAPGYNPKDDNARKKKIGVQYSSINGNGFGGYGETICGTEGTLILDRETEALLYKIAATTDKTVVGRTAVKDKDGKPLKDKDGKAVTIATLTANPKGDEQSAAIGHLAMLEAVRGYTEELEHWAWCIRNPAEENQPKCGPKVAMADAVIALTSNMAARQMKRIEFDEAWFDPDSDATPEGEKPDVSKYKPV